MLGQPPCKFVALGKATMESRESTNQFGGNPGISKVDRSYKIKKGEAQSTKVGRAGY